MDNARKLLERLGRQLAAQDDARRTIPQPSAPGPHKRLCIGMATYDDFDGVYFTVQSMRLAHPEVLADTSFLVLDNHPEGETAGSAARAGGQGPRRSVRPVSRVPRHGGARPHLPRGRGRHRHVRRPAHPRPTRRAPQAARLLRRRSRLARHRAGAAARRHVRRHRGNPLRAGLGRGDVRALGDRRALSRRAERAVRDPDAGARAVRVPARGVARAEPALSRLRRGGGLPPREVPPSRRTRDLPARPGVGASLPAPGRRPVPGRLAGPHPQLPPRLGGDRVGHGRDERALPQAPRGRKRPRRRSAGRSARSPTPSRSSTRSSA